MAPRNHGKYFSKKAAEKGIQLEAPDGGWGWAIVLAFGLNHTFVIAVIQNFAFIFSEKFLESGLTTMDLTLILNINSAVCNGLGLLNGPMLRRFSCRQVGVFGALLLFFGSLLTSQAVTMTYYIISYGVVFGLGFALVSPANSYSINSYFLKKRARAMGLAVTISGLGTVIMPLTVSFLLETYTAEETMLIISAVVLHCLPASLLLQPVQWHMVPAQEQPLLKTEPTIPSRRVRTMTVTSVDVGNSLFTVSEPDHHSESKIRHRLFSRSVSQQQRQTSVKEDEESCIGSLESISLSYYDKDDEEEKTTPQVLEEKTDADQLGDEKKTFFKKIVEYFDLDLLCNPNYVITTAGIALAFCAEINFFMLTPVIFRELHGFDTFQIAKYQSFLAIVDICFRLAAPYLGECFKWSNRTMYLISIVILSLCRTLIMIFLEYEYVVVIGMFLGMAKGIRTVFMPLILPSLVPLHRLPAAIGLMMVMKAIAFTTLGPVFGTIKDVTGSFVYVVIAINILTMVTAIVWLSRDVCRKCNSQET